MIRKQISARLPEMTINQIEDIKDFYYIDSEKDPCRTRYSTARIIIICVNAFWKTLFEAEHELSWIADQVRHNKMTKL